MQRLAQGDEAALEQLYDRWSKPLVNFLYGMCSDRALAEDLMQEVFVKVWRAAPRYQPLAKFSTWLFQIARNHWLNVREKKLRRIQPVSMDGGRAKSDGESGQLKYAIDSGEKPPEDHVLAGELGERIQAAVAALPEKYRDVWVLGAAQGLPYQEVSEILEIPVGTVKSRMYQAVRLLRADLERYAPEAG